MIHKNTKMPSKKWHGTKNNMDPSIFLMTSSKGYSSLVCKTQKYLPKQKPVSMNKLY